jgi:hypothetical protein
MRRIKLIIAVVAAMAMMMVAMAPPAFADPPLEPPQPQDPQGPIQGIDEPVDDIEFGEEGLNISIQAPPWTRCLVCDLKPPIPLKITPTPPR